MDKFNIYWCLRGFQGGYWKWYKRPLTLEKARIKISRLRAKAPSLEFIICDSHGKVVE